MVLEILICAYDDGILQVPEIILEPHPDVKWLVSYQYSQPSHLPVPDSLLRRTDVSVVMHHSKGLSRNRNFALQHATGHILLLADEDSRYDIHELTHLLAHFESNDDLDVACLKARTYEGNDLHDYPNYSFPYQDTPKGYWYNSQEIAFRRSPRIPTFDERFGINAPKLGCGEEEVFLWECHRNGLKIQFFPHFIVTTQGRTTRYRFYDDARLQRAKGGVLCLMHGVVGAFLRCLKYTILNAAKSNPFGLLWNMCYGIFYIKTTCKASR